MMQNSKKHVIIQHKQPRQLLAAYAVSTPEGDRWSQNDKTFRVNSPYTHGSISQLKLPTLPHSLHHISVFLPLPFVHLKSRANLVVNSSLLFSELLFWSVKLY